MTNKVCAIVGPGAGLGQALAGRFAAGGFILALLSRSPGGSAAALEAARQAGPDAGHQYFSADATKPEALEKTLGEVAATLGEIDVLIYNARGPYELRKPLDMSYADLNNIYQLEVVGAFAAAKAVMPAMVKRGHGSVIFSSATAALRGSGTNPLYAIGKFGLRGLSQSLAKAHNQDGVHVVHVRLDCTLDVPEVREWMGDKFNVEETSNCDDVAQSYWWVHEQPKSAWSNEIEIRPYSEQWTY